MTNIKTLGQATIINTSTDEKAAYALEMPVINVTPYDHQKRAFKFICNTFGLLDGDMKSNGAALLMEMGTGKTLVSVAAVGALIRKRKSHVRLLSRRFRCLAYGAMNSVNSPHSHIKWHY